VATVPGKRAAHDPDLRDRLYELLEHDHLPYSVGSRFVRLIVAIIIIDVLAMILASVPEFDAKLGRLFTIIEITAVIAFALDYFARIWSVVGHSLRDMTPTRARLEYVFSSLGIIDLLSFLPSGIALIVGDRFMLVLSGMLPFLKLVRYSPALRSLVSAARRRHAVGHRDPDRRGALVLRCAAIEHEQPKIRTIPQAMWWAITVRSQRRRSGTLGQMVSVFTIGGLTMIAFGGDHLAAFADEISGDFVVTWHATRRRVLASGRRRNRRHHAAVARADH
jgi:voltage-gated potassium channel